MTQKSYKADVSATEAYQAITSDAKAVMIDVRTAAEWVFVGQPHVTKMVGISWQLFPQMQINTAFLDQVQAAGITPEHDIYLLCRTGGRSAAAAAALTEQGYPSCFNITDGFEGEADSHGHRGKVSGWKALGLPWMQK